MTDNVTKLHLVEVGEGIRFDADEILENAKGQDLTTLVIMGETPDGTLYFAGNCNFGETLVLMEKSKLCLLSPS